jgi:hypothetical protein
MFNVDSQYIVPSKSSGWFQGYNMLASNTECARDMSLLHSLGAM